VLAVILAVQELLAQESSTLVSGGLEGRTGLEHQAGRIPARVSSSTS
jgi:hypothetical protein